MSPPLFSYMRWTRGITYETWRAHLHNIYLDGWKMMLEPEGFPSLRIAWHHSAPWKGKMNWFNSGKKYNVRKHYGIAIRSDATKMPTSRPLPGFSYKRKWNEEDLDHKINSKHMLLIPRWMCKLFTLAVDITIFLFCHPWTTSRTFEKVNTNQHAYYCSLRLGSACKHNCHKVPASQII